MRNLLALDASEFALTETSGANFRGHARRLATRGRESASAHFQHRRSGIAAGEMATMVVVLAAWAVIAGYLFGHAAEGMLAALQDASVITQAVPGPSVALS